MPVLAFLESFSDVQLGLQQDIKFPPNVHVVEDEGARLKKRKLVSAVEDTISIYNLCLARPPTLNKVFNK